MCGISGKTKSLIETKGLLTGMGFELMFHFCFFVHCLFRLFTCFFFVLILYILVSNFSFMSGRLFLCRYSTKQRIKCLAQGQLCIFHLVCEQKQKENVFSYS